MAIGAWQLTNLTLTNLADKGVRPATGVYKVALLLSTSNIGPTSTTFAGVTGQHATANGYPTGGVTVGLALAGSTSVTISLTTIPEFTASVGAIIARTAVLYEVGGDVVAYCLLDKTPADVTTTPGNTLQVNSPDVLVLN